MCSIPVWSMTFTAIFTSGTGSSNGMVFVISIRSHFLRQQLRLIIHCLDGSFLLVQWVPVLPEYLRDVFLVAACNFFCMVSLTAKGQSSC